MKNINFLFGLLFVLFIFTGCSSDDDNPNSNSPILGTWSISGDTLAMTYEDIELGDETVYLEIVLLNDTTLRIKESYEDGTWEMEEFIRE